MTLPLNKPPLDSPVTDWVWKGWFQQLREYVLALTGGSPAVTSVGASSPLASSGGTTPTISVGSTIGVSLGGTGQTTNQTAINSLSNVAAATNEHVLTKDTGTGNATYKAIPRPSFIGFQVNLNGTNQTGITTGTNTKVQFSTEEFDVGGYFDSTTNYRFTPGIAGYYLFHLQTRWVNATGATENRISRIYKNGTEVKSGIVSGADNTSSTPDVTCILFLNGSTDYVEFFVSQNSGVNQDLSGTTLQTYASGHLIGI